MPKISPALGASMGTAASSVYLRGEFQGAKNASARDLQGGLQAKGLELGIDALRSFWNALKAVAQTTSA